MEKGSLDNDNREEGQRERSCLELLGPAARCEIEAALRSLVGAPRATVRKEVATLLEQRPGLMRCELYRVLRRFRDDRGAAKGKRVKWNEEDFAILNEWYTKAPGEAIKQLLQKNPTWSRRNVEYMAQLLGLSRHRPNARPWSAEEHHYVVSCSEELTINDLADDTGRTQAAVQWRLYSNGCKGAVRFPAAMSARQAARVLDLPHALILRLIHDAVLPAAKAGRRYNIKTGALLNFCREHRELIRGPDCVTYLSEWVGELKQRQKLRRPQRVESDARVISGPARNPQVPQPGTSSEP